MNETELLLENLTFYFVVRKELPNGNHQISLSSHAPFAPQNTTFSFDSEEDTALYLLDLAQKGEDVVEDDVVIAQAILQGEQPLFVYEEKQADGTLSLSFHDQLPPETSSIVAFASRSHRLIARFLLKRLHESERVKAAPETIRRANTLIG
jgi:hypothetical protein